MKTRDALEVLAKAIFELSDRGATYVSDPDGDDVFSGINLDRTTYEALQEIIHGDRTDDPGPSL